MNTKIEPNHTRWYRVEADTAGKRCDKCNKPAFVEPLHLWEQPDTGASTIRCGRDACSPNPLPPEDDENSVIEPEAPASER